MAPVTSEDPVLQETMIIISVCVAPVTSEDPVPCETMIIISQELGVWPLLPERTQAPRKLRRTRVGGRALLGGGHWATQCHTDHGLIIVTMGLSDVCSNTPTAAGSADSRVTGFPPVNHIYICIRRYSSGG